MNKKIKVVQEKLQLIMVKQAEEEKKVHLVQVQKKVYQEFMNVLLVELHQTIEMRNSLWRNFVKIHLVNYLI